MFNPITCHDQLEVANSISRLLTTGERGKIEAAVLTNAPNRGQRAMTKRSATKAEMEAIQKGTELLQQQLEQALARIKQNVKKNKDLAE